MTDQPTRIAPTAPAVGAGLPNRCLLLLSAYAIAMRNHTLRHSVTSLADGKRAEAELVAYLEPIIADAGRWAAARAATDEVKQGLMGSLPEDWGEFIDAHRRG